MPRSEMLFSPTVTTILVFLTASFSLCNLAYDASIINNLNVLESYLIYFNLDPTKIGINVAIVNAGAFFSGPFGGLIIDHFGRRYGLIIGSSISLVGIILQVTATKLAAFVVGRFLLGFSMTIVATAGPMWLTEVAHPKYRGLLVNAMVPLLPTMGTVGSIITLGIYQTHGNWPWRGALMGYFFAPISSIIVAFFSVESPRWLIYKGRQEEAMDILACIHANGDRNSHLVQVEYREICETLEYEKANEGDWKSLINTSANRRRFSISLAINIFFQVSGSNVMPYFLTIIITAAGITDMRTVLLINLGLGLSGILETMIGVYAIHRVGRKMLLFCATGLMTACLFVLGACTQHIGEGKGYMVASIAMVFLFQLPSFASWMLLTYTYPPEVLKYSQRAKGVAASQAIGYGFACMMTYCLPIALAHIGWRFYILNGAWNVGIMAVIWFLFIETKGKTLEEMDALFEGVHFQEDIIEGVEVTSKRVSDSVDDGGTKKE